MPSLPQHFDPHPEGKVRIRVLQAVAVCFARIYHQVIVTRPPQLPRKGPAILVSNHISGLDPILIQSVCPRLITWMMAKEYFGNAILDWVFKTVDIIPVDRAARDLGSARSAMRALEAGRILGIFPEGKLSETGELLPFRVGAAMIAVKTGAPIHPVFIHGTQVGQDVAPALLHRNRCELVFGEPFSVANMDLEQANIKIRSSVQSLQQLTRHKFAKSKNLALTLRQI